MFVYCTKAYDYLVTGQVKLATLALISQYITPEPFRVAQAGWLSPPEVRAVRNWVKIPFGAAVKNLPQTRV